MTQQIVDETDRRIIRQLLFDARQPASKLARKLGMSESTIRRRIEALIQSEVIRRFTITVDYEKVGYPIMVVVGVQLGGMPGPEAAKILRGIENIVDVFTVTGEFDLILRIICRDIHCFEKIIEKVRNQAFIEQTRSFVVLNKIRDGFFDDVIEVTKK